MAFCFENLMVLTMLTNRELNSAGYPGCRPKSQHAQIFFASAPFEDTLMFATRMRESLSKQELKMEPGSGCERTYGSCTLDEDSQVPVVFLTGGIESRLSEALLFKRSIPGFPRAFLAPTTCRKTRRFLTNWRIAERKVRIILYRHDGANGGPAGRGMARQGYYQGYAHEIH